MWQSADASSVWVGGQKGEFPTPTKAGWGITRFTRVKGRPGNSPKPRVLFASRYSFTQFSKDVFSSAGALGSAQHFHHWQLWGWRGSKHRPVGMAYSQCQQQQGNLVLFCSNKTHMKFELWLSLRWDNALQLSRFGRIATIATKYSLMQRTWHLTTVTKLVRRGYSYHFGSEYIPS